MADITEVVNEEMTKFVLKHALQHYEEGWDFIYECYNKDDIIKLAGSCGKDWGTFQEALATVADFVETYNSYRDDIQAEAF